MIAKHRGTSKLGHNHHHFQEVSDIISEHPMGSESPSMHSEEASFKVKNIHEQSPDVLNQSEQDEVEALVYNTNVEPEQLDMFLQK